MKKEEVKIVIDMECAPAVIGIGDMLNKSPRTLLYGYNQDSETYHVYMREGLIYRVLYWGSSNNTTSTPIVRDFDTTIEIAHCNPGKRLYPERCDFEFCKLVSAAGGDLPFTTFNDSIEQGLQYYGKVF